MTKILKAHSHGHIKVFTETYPQSNFIIKFKSFKRSINMGS